MRRLHKPGVVQHLRATWEACIRGCLLILQMLLGVVNGSHIRALRCFLHVSSSKVPSKPLLPPRIGREKDILTVVLDLDETLVCAYDSAGLPPHLHSQAVNAGLNWFQLQCIATDKDRNVKSKLNHVTVYIRPGLSDFLTRVSEFAELVLFTAGLEGYAKPLIDKIDPDHRITARLYRPATVVTKYRDHVKDLSILGRNLRRTVIIDNNPCSFLLQPFNGIPCIPFTGEDPNDDQLLSVLLPLLELLANQEDVRPLLSQQFDMSSWFRTRGII